MLSEEEMMERMKNGWRGGKPFTVCGIGSTLENTSKVREWLPHLVKRHDITSLNDAGAGDLVWIRKIQWKKEIQYNAFDLIPRDPSVTKLDITTQAMPQACAILCRHTLNHLDDTRIGMALDLFRRSAWYLIATQFDANEERDHREFARLDLRKYLGPYKEAIDDGGALGCKLAFWEI